MLHNLTDFKLRIEEGSINNIKNVLLDVSKYKKILYVADPVVDKLYGETICKQLETFGDIEKLDPEDNTIAFAMSVSEYIITKDINLVVALGGGRVLDLCKYAAHIAKVDMLSIPTTLSNDSLASPIAVLKKVDGYTKSIYCEIPTALIIDPGILIDSPRRLIKAGIGDTLSNYTAVLDWDFAVDQGKDKINGYAYIMSLNALYPLVNTDFNEFSIDFIYMLSNCLVLSGLAMRFAGSSRPVSGSEHLFAHAIDYVSKKNYLHGLSVGLGTIATLKLIGKEYEKMVRLVKKFEIPLNPKDLEINKEDFIAAFKLAPYVRNDRYTHLHSIKMKDDVLSNLYDELVNEL